MSYDSSLAKPRIAAGALFVNRDRVLLVGKTYGNRWDIPGGYVEEGESPASACEREILEEIGIKRSVKRLLVHDWAPNDHEGDKMLYVFDCGELGADEQLIRVDGNEIDTVAWTPVQDLDSVVIPRLARRLKKAYLAHQEGVTFYLEYGVSRA